MPVTFDLDKLKAELRIDGTTDDTRLEDLITEALHVLQKYSSKTIVDTVTDSASQRTLTVLDKRYVYLYVGMYYDGRSDWLEALNRTLEIIRDQ